MRAADLSVGEQVALVLGHFGVRGRGAHMVTLHCFKCSPAVEIVKVTSGMGADEMVLACLTHWRQDHRREQP